ncbi:PREDICTED: ubiquitin-associated domain-containing protein 1 [Rhagoletis zephyria]|uniref:ubiquitin-associated domain-containing protein 1 n=1 Tax=Rhagoletis zephyria TaxID=28612 RepID=UPI00081144C1|nr:PREDICTED: ubiquitin-associated domain-containing protein 1 [Rhagoletis zephyria]XP_017478096.1 PREDICTED: ubiquitin-associated domain-containing protein 1 [Rhagoletis zephyria]
MIPWMRARWAARNKRTANEEKSDTAQPTCVEAVRDGGIRASSANSRTQTAPTTSVACESHPKHVASPARHSAPPQRRSRSAVPVSPARHVILHPNGRAVHMPPIVQSLSQSQQLQQASPTVTPQPRRVSRVRGSRRSAVLSSSDCATAASSDNIDRETPKERIKVRVICPSARVLIFEADVNKRITELKNEVMLELSDDPSAMTLFAPDVRQLGPRYRIMRAEYQGAELNESMTLAQLKIEDNSMLVLVPRRQNLQQMTALTREVQPPREVEINAATRNILPHTADMPLVDINEIFQQSNLQFDVRKVLISLAQASAAIIGAGPYATRLIAMLKQKLINKRNYQNDTLQCLVDMGFKKEKAEYALKVNQGVYSAALEWLIQHQSEEGSEEEAAMGLQKSLSVLSPSGIITNDSIVENTEALLEIVRIYSHRDIPPSPETISSLVEMGFEETEVLNALKKTCNNKAAACEWLCGNRTGSLIELREGLSQDSPILKAILEMPQVQMNLSNPKILIAFLSILENENSIRVWGGDNDTTSVITHILQKYHEEKHVLGINQFYSNRQ